ncbi:hypothetical protein LCP9604111_3049 [Penicillium roqueforti]|uniref:uncharacterized protein n=1 Tax=Penicillium roqueforti TaxID=5082 RepID=UPI00190DD7F5|nr:uncharacterized protein LCP9604111_3049 [Penicillium roqueforti]KAF9250845.1 hypothetical protein LCP9604111_3049 [Penicillium roqueforti]
MSKPAHYKSINPATGELFQSYKDTTDQEVSNALDRAQECFTDDWRRRTIAERSEVLHRVARLMSDRSEHMATLITKEMGKLYTQALAEVSLSVDILTYYATNAEEFLKGTTIHEHGASSEVICEPFGIILAIEPWNFPYYQLARVAGPQLMAGNVVLLKHAARVPQCALAFSQLFEDAGAPEGAWTNLFCTRSQIETIIDDFRVRGVTLTGSERAGSIVAECAGRNLKKVILELGGSDPFIVLEDADLDFAIAEACAGRIWCLGQVCSAPKRFIVVGKERTERFIEGMRHRFSSRVAGDPMDPHTAVSPLSSESAMKVLLDEIDKAKSHGATVLFGGNRIDRPGFYIESTMITDVTPENPIFYEELFGPVSMVFSVDTDDAAIELANATKFGLGSSVISENHEHARAVANKIEAGMVFINSFFVTVPELPFGGVKNSGFGRELSELGIGEFINKKLIRVAPESKKLVKYDD